MNLHTHVFMSTHVCTHYETLVIFRIIIHMAFPLQDLSGWACSRSEVEVVDMVLRLRAKLTTADTLHVSQHTRDKLNANLQTLFKSLPEDLQSVLCAT